MGRYKQKEKTRLIYVTPDIIIETARQMKLPVQKWGQGDHEQGRWQRWAEWGEIVEAAGRLKHIREDNKRLIDEWLAVKDVENYKNLNRLK
jgi:hypothetical protein